jgi:hypothetical protein
MDSSTPSSTRASRLVSSALAQEREHRAIERFRVLPGRPVPGVRDHHALTPREAAQEFIVAKLVNPDGLFPFDNERRHRQLLHRFPSEHGEGIRGLCQGLHSSRVLQTRRTRRRGHGRA